jgi:hypothetical protein
VRTAAVAILSAALFACAFIKPPAPAVVRVDLVRAAPPVLDWDQAVAPPVHVLLDATSSMAEASSEGVTHLRVARHAAARFLRSLPPDADVTLHVLGTAIGSVCTEAIPVRAPPDAPPGEGLARIAGVLPSRSEGSLASALETIARRIQSEEEGRAGVRVLAISDLDGSCAERDLCHAAEALSSAGADLDLVVIGEAPVSPCLGEVGGDEEPALFAAAPVPPAPATFRVTREETRVETPPPAVGTVGGRAVHVAPGRIRITVDLDPPVEVGPVELAPNAFLRIRILEVAASDSQSFEVFVDGVDDRGEEGSAP